MKNARRNKPKRGRPETSGMDVKRRISGTTRQEIPNMHEVPFNDAVSILLGGDPERKEEEEESEDD